jgi:hypothetical protein
MVELLLLVCECRLAGSPIRVLWQHAMAAFIAGAQQPIQPKHAKQLYTTLHQSALAMNKLVTCVAY